MSDLDKLKNLFNEWNLEYSIDQDETEICIHLEPGNNKIVGYSMFCTDFKFDLNGKFIEVGIYE